MLALQSTNEPFSKEVDKVILTNRYFLNGGPVLQLQKSGWDQDGIELGFRRQDSFGLNIRRRVELPKRAVELDGKVVKLADVSTPEKMEAFQAAEEKADAIKLEVSSDGNSSINMTDKSGKKRAELWTDEDAAYLQILDANANPRATVGTAHVVKPDGSRITFPEASLLLCDPEGKTIWHAP